MSWLYSQALVEEYSAATSSDGVPSAPSSVTPMPRAYCSPDKMTDVSRLSRFGMTFAPLTDEHGEGLLTWFREAFLARTSASPGAEPELMEPGLGFGLKCLGLLARFNLGSCSWKTLQLSLIEEESASLQTLPRWGTAADGELWELQILEHLTSENESGLLPTPNASDNRPRATANSTERRRRMGKQISLEAAVKYPTPKSRDWKDGGTVPPSRVLDPSKDTLGQHVARTQPGGQLNPTWVEWLMGWPLGWTDFAPLEMDKFQQWLQLHSLG